MTTEGPPHNDAWPVDDVEMAAQTMVSAERARMFFEDMISVYPMRPSERRLCEATVDHAWHRGWFEGVKQGMAWMAQQRKHDGDSQ